MSANITKGKGNSNPFSTEEGTDPGKGPGLITSGHDGTYESGLTQTLFGIVVLLILFTILPLIYRYTKDFWQYRNHTVFLKRYGNLTIQHICFVVLMLVWLLLSSAIIISEVHNDIFRWISHSLFIFSLCGFIWLPIVRFWHIWYDMKYVNIITSRQWKDIIRKCEHDHGHRKLHGPRLKRRSSSSGGSHHNRDRSRRGSISISKLNKHRSCEQTHFSWFIENKQSFGNYTITVYRIMYPMIIIVSVITTFCICFDNIPENIAFIISDIIYRTFLTIPLLFLVFIYVQLKYYLKFEDNFSVSKELKVLLMCTTFNISWVIVSSIILENIIEEFDNQLSSYENTLIWTIWYFVTMLVTAVMLGVQVWFQTGWVLDQIKPLLNNRQFTSKYNSRQSQKSIVGAKNNELSNIPSITSTVNRSHTLAKSREILEVDHKTTATKTDEFLTVKKHFPFLQTKRWERKKLKLVCVCVCGRIIIPFCV